MRVKLKKQPISWFYNWKVGKSYVAYKYKGIDGEDKYYVYYPGTSGGSTFSADWIEVVE